MDKYYMEVLRIVKFIETECRRVVITDSRCGGGEERWGVVFNGYRISVLQDAKSSDDGWWWWCHNSGHVLSATELCTVKMVNFMWCILELDYKESWGPKNWCFWTVVLEKTLETPLDSKEIQRVHPKGDQSWVFIGGTDAEAETPILWPPHVKSWLIWKDWCWERLRAGEEGDDRGWDGWMASLTQWTWVWVNSGSWWWTGRPGVLQSTGSQRVGHDWATELNWTDA